MTAALHRCAVWAASFALLASAVACRSPGLPRLLSVSIRADGSEQQVSVERGATVQEALQAAEISLGDLDSVEPPAYAVLADGGRIQVVRVREAFETEQVVVAFERQTLRSDTLSEGDSRLVQQGISGLQEITYRVRLEDGVEAARAVVKTVWLRAAVPEILMVGAGGPQIPLPIAGKLVYLSAGNAWLLEGSTAARRPLVATGDLDGRIFKLSPSAEYLLFTRRSKKAADQEINTLWAVGTKDDTQEPFSLNASNIVHFADWIPGTNSIAYSTVEPRAAAPGWQANNDLERVSLAGGPARVVLEPSAGGVYGWWGMSFGFSPQGKLAYSRPDQVGLVDQDGGYLKPLLDITPFNTRSDWVWVPSLAWAHEGDALILTTHAPSSGPISPEDSERFDLAAASVVNAATVPLARDVGMFAYAAAAPTSADSAGSPQQIAFLQAILPAESDRSGYRLAVMDRDGSNRRVLFPKSDTGGLEPQLPLWSPGIAEGHNGGLLAVILEGDLWLIQAKNGDAFQATGEGTLTRIDWR